jgi:NDP-sugar pyrophosphorylase family protein
MADRALAACEALSPSRRFANAFWSREQIEIWGEARCLDHVQVEPIVLDTGGALGMLRPDIQSEHLLVHNGDLVHGIDLVAAWKAHLESRAAATLVTIDRPEVNTVRVRDGRFAGVWGHPRCPADAMTDSVGRTFSGIAFYRVADLGRRGATKWSVKELWHDLLESGSAVRCWDAPADARWDDLGTPGELAAAILAEGTWIHPESHVDPTAEIGNAVVIEYEARVGAGAKLSNCAILPGAEVAPGEVLDHVIRNPAGDLPW